MRSGPVLTVAAQSIHVIAIDKPSGWLTIPGRTGAPEKPVVFDVLQNQIGQKLWVVHRLDFEVSGVLLFAKTADAHRSLCGFFESHAVIKTYEAFTEGRPPAQEQFLWESKLLRGKKRAYESPHGKLSITEAFFNGLRTFPGIPSALAWSVLPRTGRAHQIRVHLASHGFPILGDRLYGSTLGLKENTIALRAISLEFKSIRDAEDLGLSTRICVPGSTSSIT